MNHTPENLLVVTRVLYSFIFFLVKATDFWSQLCIKCFSKSSCMMLRPFPLRLMDFMISYRIRSCISVASPQFSAQMGQTVTTICFYIMVRRPWSLCSWSYDKRQVSTFPDLANVMGTRSRMRRNFYCNRRKQNIFTRTIYLSWLCGKNHWEMVQTFRLSGYPVYALEISDLVGNELSPIKKGKTTSQHQVHYNSTSAIMVSSIHQASQPKRQKPQLYRYRGQFVIYTICICECVQRFHRRLLKS